ncbi:hypothetical protein BH09BAC1_BH09BAC1_20700 [soil metagenome]
MSYPIEGDSGLYAFNTQSGHLYFLTVFNSTGYFSIPEIDCHTYSITFLPEKEEARYHPDPRVMETVIGFIQEMMESDNRIICSWVCYSPDTKQEARHRFFNMLFKRLPLTTLHKYDHRIKDITGDQLLSYIIHKDNPNYHIVVQDIATVINQINISKNN